MRKSIFVLASTLLLSTLAQASQIWAGDVRVLLDHRGMKSSWSNQGQVIEDDICNYNDFRVQYEVYKAGVTDNPNSSVWQNINAQAETSQDAGGRVIRRASVAMIGRHGNNAVYELNLRDVAPSAVTGLDPKSERSHLSLLVDGNEALLIPIHFTCTH